MKGKKASPQDIELAMRFPDRVNAMGFGMNAADARISPQQLERLIATGLIQVTDRDKNGGYAGADGGGKNLGKGAGRNHCSFIRTFKSLP